MCGKGGAAKSIIPIVLGAAGTLLGGPVLGAVLGGLSGGGMNAYAASNHPELGSPLMAGLMGAGTGALSGYGAGQLLSGGIAGGSAAAPGFLSKAGGIAQGALFGTGTSAAGNTFSLLGQGGRSVGLLGPGTLFGGLAGGSLGKAALSAFGGQAASSLLGGGNTQSKQPTYDQYVPSSFTGFNSAMPLTGTVQTIKSTPSPITGGWSSAPQKSNLVDKNLSNFDMLIPGRNRQANIYTWA